MLLNNFFFIESTEVADNVINTSLRIDKGHQIFDGHFPGQPVVPGVCMMQMIKEIMELHQHQSLLVQEASNIKFLSVIDPRQNSLINAVVTIEGKVDDMLKINASLFGGEVTFFKLKAVLKLA